MFHLMDFSSELVTQIVLKSTGIATLNKSDAELKVDLNLN